MIILLAFLSLHWDSRVELQQSLTVHDFSQYKQTRRPIVLVTCYSHWSAQLVNQTDVDAILVGDSVAMVEHGYPSTLHATVDMMARHVDAVARAANKKFIIADLPFLSYRKGLVPAMEAVEVLMRAGAHAIKLEGAAGNLEVVQHIVASGVPVMGHLGLTPQHVHAMGGYRLQARQMDEAEALLVDAKALQSAGCFSVVLECVPQVVAQRVTETLDIATIGIGAGNATNGQVLVFHDMLGLNQFQAKFMKRYMQGGEGIIAAMNEYSAEVRAKTFPAKEHSYCD